MNNILNKTIITVTFFILLTQGSPRAWAVYRAFELKIENKTKNKTRTVISTLDQYQYPKYYPLEADEVVQYSDSWMCKENTSQFKPPCKKPDPLPQPTNQSPK